MSNYLSLFHNYSFSKSLSKNSQEIVDKLIASYIDNQGFEDPEFFKLFDESLLIHFLSKLTQNNHHLNEFAWKKFIRGCVSTNHVEKIETTGLKNYILIQYSISHCLDTILSAEKRITLAYNAIHGNKETRALFLKHASHFKIDSHEIMQDLAFKCILLGNYQDIDVHQFPTLPVKLLKQIILAIALKAPEKALEEYKKLDALRADNSFHEYLIAHSKI